MWKESVVLIGLLLNIVSGATLVRCPEGASCYGSDSNIRKESSFDFLNDLTAKEYRNIVSLSLSNASIERIDPKLKYLKNLKYLDLSYNNVQVSTLPSLPRLRSLKLSHNNLKNINLSLLPHTIENLDISSNLLANIPRDWTILKSLKTLEIYKNPLNCECINYNVLLYAKLIKEGISLPGNITCHLPMQFRHKSIAFMNCSLADIMQYDEAVEGSGAVDVFDDISSNNVDHLNEEEIPDVYTVVDDKLTTVKPDEVEEEGSGEGSGFGSIEISNVPACHVNCSTPEPIGTDDEADASPLPNIIKQIGIIGGDIINGLKGEHETTPSTKMTTNAITTTTESSITTLKEVTEEIILKEKETTLLRASDKSDVEVFNITKPGEMERAFIVNENSSAVYIVLGICILLAAVFLVCLVKKRRNSRTTKNRRELPSSFGEEMKPLSKSPIQSITNEKPSNNIPEHIPLMNGQNGKKHDDTPVLTSFTPLAHPEILKEDIQTEPSVEMDEDIPDDVEIRERIIPELLTPPRERVTVRASEILDSIPKTPVLVHRQKNSEGEIVTTVIPP